MYFPKCVPAKSVLFLSFLLVGLTVSGSFAQETAALKLVVNKEAVGDFFFVITSDGDVWIRSEDIRKTRLREGLGMSVWHLGESYVSLRSISGLKYFVNVKEVSLDVEAPPELLEEQLLDVAYERPYGVIYTDGDSGFFNYGVFYGVKESSVNLSTEIGARHSGFFVTSTFNYNHAPDEDNFVRLLTYIRKDSRKQMRTLTLGDVSGASGILGSALSMGGISITKNFSIEPYFIKFPSLNLSGTLDTPSEIELYVNGQLISRNNLYPGAFELRNVNAEVGSGTAEIVIKDIYGRKQTISRSFFYSDRFLRKGLHEYKYSMGFMREDYGEKSFSYGKPVFMSSHNYGLNEKLKVGYSAEASEKIVNGGPAVSFFVAKGIIIDTAFSFSNSEGESGYGAFIGYSYPGRFFGFGLSARTLSRGYSNLALNPSDDKKSAEYTVSAGSSLGVLGSVSAGYSFSERYLAGKTDRISGTYRRAVGRMASFFVMATRSKDYGAEAEHDVFFGLNTFLSRDVSVNLDYNVRDGRSIRGASFKKNISTGTGIGAEAAIRNSDSDNDINAASQYQGDFGIYGLKYRRFSGEDNYYLSLSGGIGYIDGTLFLSRPVTDSFAKVKAGGLRGVKVYHYGNEAGKTGRDGATIIPDMRSFHDNKVSIEPRDIPVNYVVKSVGLYVSPPFRGGSVIDFDVKKVQGFSGNAYFMKNGKKTPVEFAKIAIDAKGAPIRGIIGKRGEFYLENIPPGRHKARILHAGKECRFDIIIPMSYDIWVNLGDVLCEEFK